MKRQELLAVLVEEVLSGKCTVEECSARYPEIAEDLRSLIQIATTIEPDDVLPTPEFREQARKRLAEEMRSVPSKISHRYWYLPRLINTKTLAVTIITLFLIITAGGTTVYAAQHSLPGDSLYPVKTGIENLQLAITPGAGAKARLYLNLIQRRIIETIRQAKVNREINPKTSEIIGEQIDQTFIEINKVNDSQVVDEILGRLTSSTLEQQLELEGILTNTSSSNKPVLTRVLSMTYRSQLIAQVAYTNRQYLSRLPSVSNDEVEVKQFMIDGTIISIQGQSWNVGGIMLNNVYSSTMKPDTGNRVIIEGIVKGKEIFISRVEAYRDSSEITMMAGRFGGMNADGTANISGVPVTINNDNSAWPETGDRVQLEGRTEDKKLSIITQTGITENSYSGISQSGTLLSINSSGTEIILTSAGNQIIIDISKARISGKRGRLLRIIELRKMLGRHLIINGLYKNGNRIFARRVIVEN